MGIRPQSRQLQSQGRKQTLNAKQNNSPRPASRGPGGGLVVDLALAVIMNTIIIQ